MRNFLLHCALCGLLGMTSATATAQSTTAILKQVITLNPSSYEGGNGAGVVWNPSLRLYYAARAGNANFPLDVFDATGKQANQEAYTTLVDLRTLWYNTTTRQLCAAGFSEAGWGYYDLNKSGMPQGYNPIAEGQHQPDANSVGCYDAKKGRIYFLNGMRIMPYFASNGEEALSDKVLNLRKGIGKAYELELSDDLGLLPDFYNQTLIYTGQPDAEFGLLNVTENRIDLYSARTGMRTKVLKLPAGATDGVPSMFNFAYANGTFFLYSKDREAWVGYR